MYFFDVFRVGKVVAVDAVGEGYLAEEDGLNGLDDKVEISFCGGW